MSKGYVLVTGGAGYIGCHVSCALKKRGFTPIIVDNLSHGHRAMVKFFPLIEGDIGDAELIHSLCKTYHPIAVLHFAALIEVAESVANPDLYMHNNYTKACALFESLQTNHIGNIVFSSTAAVYGMPSHNNPLTEQEPLHPINPYGVSKLKAEIFLRELPNIRSVSLRYFNAAGASTEDGIGEAHWPESHLIPNALLSLLQLKTQPLMLFGQDYPTLDGTALRDYIHVLDLAEAHILALEYLINGGENCILNLGNGTGYTVRQVFDTVETVTGKVLAYQSAPRRAGDPPALVADNRKARQILGWQPQYTLKDIITSAYKWHTSPFYKELIEPLR